MIEKLSDILKEQITREVIPMDSQLDGFIMEALHRACHFYDAQIDAQAKTMDELYKIFNNIEGNPDAEIFMLRKNHTKDYAESFAYCIDFFLAVGGRIRE